MSLESPDVDPQDAEEQVQIERLMNHPCFPADNRERWLAGELVGIEAGELCNSWSQLFLPIHGTTIERAISIFRDGHIYSHKALKSEHPEIIADRMSLATDQLDEEMGQDNYVFLNVGRVNPGDIHDIYLCFSNEIIEESGSLVAFREVAHYGAKVSPEAARIYTQLHPRVDIDELNRQAVTEYCKDLFFGKDFPALFAKFLQKYYSDTYYIYLRNLLYPNTQPETMKVGGYTILSNGWEGPQLQIPGKISADKVKTVLVTTRDRKKIRKIQKQLKKAGVPKEQIVLMDEAIPVYRQQTSANINYDNPLDKYGFINMALRDLALIGRNNRFGESNPNNMNAFKNRT